MPPLHACVRRIEGHDRLRCTRSKTKKCSGCREDSGMDCQYESLLICAACGGMEGSLLPFCPGRTLDINEDQRNYKHYCAGTGPFAMLTEETWADAYKACEEYLLRNTEIPYGRVALLAAVMDMLPRCYCGDIPPGGSWEPGSEPPAGCPRHAPKG